MDESLISPPDLPSPVWEILGNRGVVAKVSREMQVPFGTVWTWRKQGIIPLWRRMAVLDAICRLQLAIPDSAIAYLSVPQSQSRRGIKVDEVFRCEGNVFHEEFKKSSDDNDLLKALHILRAMTDDYAVSKRHHPNHVLVSKEAFDEACALIEMIDGREGQ